MFNFFKATPQVKVEAIDSNGDKTTFYQDILPIEQSELDAAKAKLKKTGKVFSSIKVTYPQ